MKTFLRIEISMLYSEKCFRLFQSDQISNNYSGVCQIFQRTTASVAILYHKHCQWTIFNRRLHLFLYSYSFHYIRCIRYFFIKTSFVHSMIRILLIMLNNLNHYVHSFTNIEIPELLLPARIATLCIIIIIVFPFCCFTFNPSIQIFIPNLFAINHCFRICIYLFVVLFLYTKSK